MAARHRFYLLIAGLASCAMMNKSHGKDIGYTIGEVLYFHPYCASPASGDGDTPCQVCVPSRIAYDKCNYSTSCIDNWINDENICIDNTCSSYKGTSNIHYGGAYGKNSGGGFYICDDYSGWKYSATQPDTNPDNCSNQYDGNHGHLINCCDFDPDAGIGGSWCPSGYDREYCDSGYYGGFNNCAQCPSGPNYVTGPINDYSPQGPISGKSSESGNYSKNKCYIPPLGGSEHYMDSTGQYVFTSNCYWS